VHHAPQGPPLAARVAGLLARARFRTATVLAPLITVVAVVRRTRLVPVAVAGLVLGAFALTAPLTPVADGARDTAALVAPTEGARPLVPATGDGWTQDGVPAEPSSSERASRSARESSPASASSSAPGGKSSRATGASSAAPPTAAKAPAPAAGTGAASASSGGGASSAKPSTVTETRASTASKPSTPSAPSAPARPSATAGTTPPAPSGGLEGQVLALVNAERAAAGCAALAPDAQLAAVARAHSEDMRDRGFFDHVNPDRIGPFDRARQAGLSHARAENIAQGQSSPAAVMAAWMGSDGHRANILDCDLRTLGVGVASGSGGPWWTQLFGA
jgi:uncharacterized protein YkwD